MKKLLASSLFLSMVAFGGAALANDQDAIKCDEHGRNCEVSFTAASVGATLVRPDEVRTSARNQAIPSNLIKIRTNFIFEMLKSVEGL